MTALTWLLLAVNGTRLGSCGAQCFTDDWCLQMRFFVVVMATWWSFLLADILWTGRDCTALANSVSLTTSHCKENRKTKKGTAASTGICHRRKAKTENTESEAKSIMCPAFYVARFYLFSSNVGCVSSFSFFLFHENGICTQIETSASLESDRFWGHCYCAPVKPHDAGVVFAIQTLIFDHWVRSNHMRGGWAERCVKPQLSVSRSPLTATTRKAASQEARIVVVVMLPVWQAVHDACRVQIVKRLIKDQRKLNILRKWVSCCGFPPIFFLTR